MPQPLCPLRSRGIVGLSPRMSRRGSRPNVKAFSPLPRFRSPNVFALSLSCPRGYTRRRRRGRVVEGTPLLRVQAGNRLEGSNPFVSATSHLRSVHLTCVKCRIALVLLVIAGLSALSRFSSMMQIYSRCVV